MNGTAIAAAALGYAGLGMLTSDIGATRLAETLRLPGDARAARAGRTGPAAATRP